MMQNVKTLLPPNASRAERALEQAAAEPVIDMPVTLIRKAKDPRCCPAALLPWLAWEFAVDFWEDDWSEQQKRQVISDAAYIHQHRGTAGAVRRALSSIGFPAIIVEWWQEEPEAAPYTFRVEVYSETGISDDLYTTVRRQTDIARNLRSYLRSIDIIASTGSSGAFYCAGVITAVIDTDIYPQGVA